MSFLSRLTGKKDEKKDEKKEDQKAPKEAPKEKKETPKAAPAEEEETLSAPDENGKAKTWHITKRAKDGMWQVKGEGNDRATKLFRTKAEAEEYVKSLKANNKGSKVISHTKDGHFQKK